MRLTAILAVLLTAACRRPQMPALSAADGEVSSIAISRGVHAFILIQSPVGHWRVDPLTGTADEADAAGASALLAGLRGMRTDYSLPGDGKPEGLASVDMTDVALYVGDQTKPAFEANFGRRALGRAVYAAALGGPVLLVEGPDPALLDRTAAEWRERLLMGEDCARVSVDAGRGFRDASPETAAALCAASASAITADLPASVTGLDRPILRARAASASLSVGARLGDQRWIRIDGRPGLFRAPAEVFETAAAEAAR